MRIEKIVNTIVETMTKIKEKIEEKIGELQKNLKVAIESIVDSKNKIIYKIDKKIYNLKYRRATYVPEKGLWVSTVVFPKGIASIDSSIDGKGNITIYGVTDVFAGDEKKVYFESLYAVYIKKPSESGDVHRDVVKRVKCGYVTENIINV